MVDVLPTNLSQQVDEPPSLWLATWVRRNLRSWEVMTPSVVFEEAHLQPGVYHLVFAINSLCSHGSEFSSDVQLNYYKHVLNEDLELPKTQER
jgi:hypothetical protein